ncbi:MAG: polysaccharide export protein [Brevundimonas sp.]|nr:MAG: polysaccharide export protein [Brevundimonas sp.]
MQIDRRNLLISLSLAVPAAGLVSGCGGVPMRLSNPGDGPDGPRIQRTDAASFPVVGFADWTDAEPEYVLFPGDEIEVATPTASELTHAVRIGPDGRIQLPLIGQLMAADRTIQQLETDASTAYARELRRPAVEVTLKAAGPLKVWVAGEVRTPGVYDMIADTDALQAVISAGGFTPTARRSEVGLIRRGPGGVRMLRRIDLHPTRGETVAVRRGDIIYVPTTTLGEVANFFTQVRNAIPIGFTYSINGQYQSF